MMHKPLNLLAALALACGLMLSGCGKGAPAAVQPTAAPSPAPTATALPTSTPKPSPSPAPTATPLPYAALSYQDWLLDPETIVLFEPDDFLQGIQDVTRDPESCLEKQFCIAGLYVLEQPEGLGVTAHYIFRNGPEDPELESEEDDGDDAFYGMQFIPPEGFSAEDGDWVVVKGTLRTVFINEYPFLALDDTQAIVDNEHTGSITLEPEA